MQAQEGHSIGSFGVWEAQPQFWIEIELPQRAIIGRVGGSRYFWVGMSPSPRILQIKKRQERPSHGFPTVLTIKEGEGE